MSGFRRGAWEHAENNEAETAAPVPGKRSLVSSRYPALARALGARGDSDLTIHDAATAAVENKGSGSPIDAEVAGMVGAHLGVDFTGVRTHGDPLAQQATAAMGARAFAYGSDIFLGPGESGGDLGLMAHELTHVAQQGAAGQRAPQRAVTVGDANSPAEQQADQVAAQVTGKSGRPETLLVDQLPVGSGQMLKSQFCDQLRAQVTEAANQELGPVYSAIGCPYIDLYFRRYAGQPASAVESLLRRFAPAIRSARTASEMIPIVVERVREGVRSWRDTGVAPPEVAGEEPATAAAANGPAQAQALRASDGRETLASLESELGPGNALDGATASRMSGALGVDVSSARIHTGPIAARKAADADALAFAVGHNVVMGAHAPAAGTIEGDALLAHELIHTSQQASAASDPAARRRPIGAESPSAEDHADAASAGAVAALQAPDHRTAGRAKVASRLLGAVQTGLQLQRCHGAKQQQQQQQTEQPSAGQPSTARIELRTLEIGEGDAQIKETIEYQTLMDPGQTWQTAEHVTEVEALRTCRLILGALRGGTQVDFNSQAQIYLTKARAELGFQGMWDAHPHNNASSQNTNISSPDVLNDQGLPASFGNTCAIRLSVMLNGTGNAITPEKAAAAGLARAPTRSTKTNQYYILAASEMWQYLSSQFRQPDAIFPETGTYANAAAFQTAFDATIKPLIAARKGIVGFEKIFGFSGTGHIDLFDGETLSDSASWYPCKRLRLWYIVVP